MRNVVKAGMLGVQLAPEAGYTPALNDFVELNGTTNEVQKVATLGSLKVVGRVVAIEKDAPNGTPTGVTVECAAKGIWNLPSGAAIAATGPVVFDAAGKVISYVNPTHDPASIIGLAVETCGAADVEVAVLRFR